MNSPAEHREEPQLAEPHLRAVLASAGLDAEYVRAEANTLYLRGEDGGEIPVTDFAGGYGSLLLGHNPPGITAYAKRLLDDRVPVHAQFSVHPEANRLALALNRVLQRELGEDEPFLAIFANSGAEAVEAALKHAELDRVRRLDTRLERVAAGLPEVRAAVAEGRAALPGDIWERVGAPAPRPDGDGAALEELIGFLTRRNAERAALPPVFLAPEGSFHGKLVGSVQLTHNEGYRAPFRALAARARFVPVDRPGVLREIVEEERTPLTGLTVEDGRVVPFEVDAPRIGAFVLEPLQGEGGIRELPREFAEEVQRECAAIDCPVVVDEIQSGLGRTGSFLASTALGLRGDYYTLGKGLGGGIAKTSVLLVRASRYQERFELIHSSTFAKDAFSTLIALRVVEILEADGGRVYRRAAERGGRLKDVLSAVHKDHPEVVKDVRGRGLMLGLEFHDQSDAPAGPVREAARAGLFGYLVAGHLLRGHRVRTFPTASAVNTLRFEPSVLLTDGEIAALDTALRDVCDIVRGGYRRPLDLPV
ncbi:aspartate aminotransferase family protein [Streptomyces sp. JNUCC 64]